MKFGEFRSCSVYNIDFLFVSDFFHRQAGLLRQRQEGHSHKGDQKFDRRNEPRPGVSLIKLFFFVTDDLS